MMFEDVYAVKEAFKKLVESKMAMVNGHILLLLCIAAVPARETNLVSMHVKNKPSLGVLSPEDH